MLGIVQWWDVHNRALGVVKSGRKTYLAIAKDIAGDCYGRKYLVKGERCSFESGTRDGNPIALLVNPDRPEVYDPEYRETGELLSWHNDRGTGYGVVRRYLFNHFAYVSADEIETLGEATLHRGSEIRFGLLPPRDGEELFRAVAVEIFI